MIDVTEYKITLILPLIQASLLMVVWTQMLLLSCSASHLLDPVRVDSCQAQLMIRCDQFYFFLSALMGNTKPPK